FVYSSLIQPYPLQNPEEAPGETRCHFPAQPFCFCRPLDTRQISLSIVLACRVSYRPIVLSRHNLSCIQFLFLQFFFPIQILPAYRSEMQLLPQSLRPSPGQPSSLQNLPKQDRNVQKWWPRLQLPQNTRTGMKDFPVLLHKVLFDCLSQKDEGGYKHILFP